MRKLTIIKYTYFWALPDYVEVLSETEREYSPVTPLLLNSKQKGWYRTILSEPLRPLAQ